MGMYESFARVYDTFMDNVPYEEWCARLTALLRERGIEDGLVLDLGCGTGRLSVEFARRGYDVIGVDASPEMLAAAYARKTDEQLPDILFLEQDMRDFELYGTVSAAVSSLDCVNYLVNEGDLDRCFTLVHNYLDPNGIFLFDVNTPYKFEHVYGDNAYILEEGDAFCAWQNSYDPTTRRCRFDLSVFTRDKGAHYTRADEVQEERCYNRTELTEALTRAGFADIAFFADGTLGAPRDDADRWFVAARCKK